MTLFIPAAITLDAVGLSRLLTVLIRRFALRAHLLDIPNERSWHTVLTPRGGGGGVVLSCLAIIIVVGLPHKIEQRLMIAALGDQALA